MIVRGTAVCFLMIVCLTSHIHSAVCVKLGHTCAKPFVWVSKKIRVYLAVRDLRMIKRDLISNKNYAVCDALFTRFETAAEKLRVLRGQTPEKKEMCVTNFYYELAHRSAKIDQIEVVIKNDRQLSLW
jgi:hypothetical protein